jgi:hypothetical protein
MSGSKESILFLAWPLSLAVSTTKLAEVKDCFKREDINGSSSTIKILRLLKGMPEVCPNPEFTLNLG